METPQMPEAQTSAVYFDPADCSLDAFRRLIDRQIDQAALTFADQCVSNIPIYRAPDIAPLLERPDTRRAVLAEWVSIFKDHSGALVLKGALADHGVIDEATRLYQKIIESESKGASGGDHFAKSGANARIWNSLQKLCEASPDIFARYFGNPVLAAVCEAWLGPSYQMTAQVNLVRPGGEAQQAHRDYHLGFQSDEYSAGFPQHVHDLSPVLTLQGAIAHVDMPIESGPTKLLPFSQIYRQGYLAWRRDDFRAVFEERFVQLPLEKGDGLFFNPAIFHAAGANTSADIERMGNLLQVSSAFGIAMETIDRTGMCKQLYPVLLEMKRDGRMGEDEIAAAVAACADGYPFPTNLDTDPPIGGLAPESQQALFLRALDELMPFDQFQTALDDQRARRQT